MIPWGEPVPGAAHARECRIFTGGHDASGRFHPAPCDCWCGMTWCRPKRPATDVPESPEPMTERERRYHESNQWGR